MKHHPIRIIIVSILFFTFFLVYRLVSWVIVSFSGMTVDKIVFELQVPLEGTGTSITQSAIRYCLYPSIVLTLFVILILVLCDRAKKVICLSISLKDQKETSKVYRLKIWPFPFIKTLTLLLACTFLLAGVYQADHKIGLLSYINSQTHSSKFIEQNYIDPTQVKLTFPAKKQNLIYIYMESMESTYADTSSGGLFLQNYILELADLVQKNVNFSSNTSLGGALPVYGTQWTMGAMFAHSTGLPLSLPIGSNDMSKYSKFFPGVTTIGEILEENGYHNVLFLGSDATFGGRKQFYTQHGNYDICDYNYAIKKGLIPPNYKVWWGYEDQKLFAFAKAELEELSRSNQPFNLTMLTVDTHFQDGYVCDLCQKKYPSQYANVIACSSRQVTDFVEWIQQQDFYKDTTVILTGDHETMQTNFIPTSSQNQRSVYHCYINAVPQISQAQTKNRQFSAFDFFPTTLASLGVDIQGDHLGLGVNLFSGKETLLEEYGDQFSDNLSPKSTFYDQTFIYAKSAK